MYVHTRGREMRLANAIDLGLYVREWRQRLSLTQANLAAAAQVSRRWLSDLESGKPTAEIGLVFKVLHALDLALEVSPVEDVQGDFDLDDILRAQGQIDVDGSSHG